MLDDAAADRLRTRRGEIILARRLEPADVGSVACASKSAHHREGEG